MKVLIFGANGMLGHVLFNELRKQHEVRGVSRTAKWHPDIIEGVNVDDMDKVEHLVDDFKPDFIVNAIGLIKQLEQSKNKLLALQINSVWPQQLNEIAARHQSKCVFFSTDCVFSGTTGNYKEDDFADSRDVYGLSKYLGEVEAPNALTLRTSIIGHELNSHRSLIDWFLSQKGPTVPDYDHAIYSGFPTIYISRFLNDHVFKHWISGVYHLSSEPISKYDLLNIVNKVYVKNVQIVPSKEVIIDRSLDSSKLRKTYNLNVPTWTDLVNEMHAHYLESGLYKRVKT